MLIQRDITKVQLRADVGISAGTMSKLNKGEDVALSVLLRICDYLNCDIGDICEAVRVENDWIPFFVQLLCNNEEITCQT